MLNQKQVQEIDDNIFSLLFQDRAKFRIVPHQYHFKLCCSQANLQLDKNFLRFSGCGGIILAGYQTPTQQLSLSPSLEGQGEEIG